ncbi:haloacid dehalogenase [Whalleya microplaca]|nr:haloacid dehalogenase [Whalleya microplaca]
MASLKDFRVLSFDVYGTLIDWETGVLAALQPLLSAHPATADIPRAQLLSHLHELCTAQQLATPELPYADLLSTVHPQLAARLGLNDPPPPPAQSQAFGASVGDWPAFPDTVAALRRLAARYKLVVLSNVDRASFGRTCAGPLAGAPPFDLVVTAQDVGAYKPSPRNFEAVLGAVRERFGAERAQVLVTAQSQFHDHHPARALGLRSAWIVRPGAVMGNREEEVWDWRFDTLGDMADAVEAELA